MERYLAFFQHVNFGETVESRSEKFEAENDAVAILIAHGRYASNLQSLYKEIELK